jgi:hypothetical protein
MCNHFPTCAPATSPAHGTARVIASYPEQGWSLLCNGVVLFDDYGELLPDGRAVAPPPVVAVASGPVVAVAHLTVVVHRQQGRRHTMSRSILRTVPTRGCCGQPDGTAGIRRERAQSLRNRRALSRRPERAQSRHNQ